VIQLGKHLQSAYSCSWWNSAGLNFSQWKSVIITPAAAADMCRCYRLTPTTTTSSSPVDTTGIHQVASSPTPHLMLTWQTNITANVSDCSTLSFHCYCAKNIYLRWNSKHSVFESLGIHFIAVLADVYQAGLLTPRSNRSRFEVFHWWLSTQM